MLVQSGQRLFVVLDRLTILAAFDQFTGKVMKGWARVEPAGIEEDEDLKSWLRRAAAFASSLPPK